MLLYDDTRPELIRGRIWLTLFSLLFLYGLANLFFPNPDTILGSHALRMAGWSSVMFVYGGDAIAALRTRKPEREDYLIVGIWFSAMANVWQSGFNILGRLGGLPTWWLNTDIMGVGLMLSVAGAVLHVSSPGATGRGVPTKNKILMGVFFGAGVLAFASLALLRPDLTWFIEEMKPYLSSDYLPYGVGGVVQG